LARIEDVCFRGRGTEIECRQRRGGVGGQIVGGFGYQVYFWFGQDAVAHAKAIEQGLRTDRQVATMPQQAPRANRQFRDHSGPLILGERGTRERSERKLRVGPGEPGKQCRIADSRAAFGSDTLALRKGDHRSERVKPAKGSTCQAGISAGVGLSQEVEQLPELHPRGPLPRCAVVQHGGKAVVDVHEPPGELQQPIRPGRDRCDSWLLRPRCREI
jgi:hypothetical protein